MRNQARKWLEEVFNESTYLEHCESSREHVKMFLQCASEDVLRGSLHFLNRLFSIEASLFCKAIQTQLLVTDQSKEVFEYVVEQLPVLRRYIGVDVGEDKRADLIEILRTFTQKCSLEGEDQEPHQQNQKILYNFW